MTLEYDTKEDLYSNKRFNKVDINFVKIELLYKKYKSLFFIKSQLYKHLRDGYTSLIRALLLGTFEQALFIPLLYQKR